MSEMSQNEFIAFDWCGWNNRFGRFTHIPSGATLTQQQWMGQTDWNKAQLEWFKQFKGDLLVHKCTEPGPYRESGNVMGTVEEIIKRLELQYA